MIADIEESLKAIEEHLENINDIMPGVPDENAEDILEQIQEAEYHMKGARKSFESEETENRE